MKKTTKVLLLGVSLTSTITAGITSSNSAEYKNKNIELTKKLKESFANYDKLSLQNKKLSKRVVNEINRIITLSDSVKHLDETLKKNQLEHDKIILSAKLNSERKTPTSRNSNLSSYFTKTDILNKHNQLSNQISKSKQEILEVKKSITHSVFISNIETTPMKKKTRGGFTETSNYKKIDGFRTKFQIINNDISNTKTKKISLKLFNSENKALDFTNELEVSFDKKFLNIVSLIEVERKQMTSGNYKLVVMVDNKEIKSSNIEITIK